MMQVESRDTRGGASVGDGIKVLQAVQEVLDQSAAFGDLLTAAEKEYLLENGVVRRARAGDVLCRQHQRDQSAFIVVFGQVAVVETVDGEPVPLAKLGRGELCGEIGALFGGPRHSTVSASQPSVLLEIPGPVLSTLVDRNPRLRNEVIRRYRGRVTDTAVRSVPVLRYMPETARHALISTAGLVCFPAGTAIVNEDERGDALYLIVCGAARVTRKVGGRALNLAILGPGDYFGERALLTGAPRAATVVAATEIEAMRVDLHPFLDFIQQHPEIRDRIDQVAHNRHEELLHAGVLSESVERIDALLADMDDIIATGDTPARKRP